MRFFLAGILVIGAVGALIFASVEETAKKVVTVGDLVAISGKRPTIQPNIRLGARVTEDEINYRMTPDFLLRFHVRDPAGAVGDAEKIAVVYHGTMPDTLQAGRDVILEGDFDGNTFMAKSLFTQCPSKYEPPIPGGGSAAKS